MNRLNRDARALFDRARALHEPTPADRQKVRRALAFKLPAAAIVTTVISQAAPAAAGSLGTTLPAALAVKWLIGGVLLGSVGVGVLTIEGPTSSKQAPVASKQLHAEVPKSPSEARSAARLLEVTNAAAPEVADVKSREVQSARSGPAASPPATAATAVPPTTPIGVRASDGAAAFPQASGHGADDAPASAKPASATPNRDDLLREARALRTAQAALSEGRATDALELLRLQALQFPAGALQEERSAARLLALCALGQTDPVRQEVARFLEVSKNSPLAPRVRAACTKR